MGQQFNLPHPGDVLRDGVFAEMGITITEFAARLGVTRVALSRVLNGKAAISAGMAVRLAKALGGRPLRGYTCRRTSNLKTPVDDTQSARKPRR